MYYLPPPPPKIGCALRGAVYKINCTRCNRFYIGKSNTNLRDRLSRHSREYTTLNPNNPLTAHAIHCPDPLQNITPLGSHRIEILGTFKPGLATDLAEAKFIRTLQPEINRRQELTTFI